MTDVSEDERYMHMALEEARAAAAVGEVPIGAVVVYDATCDPASPYFVTDEMGPIQREAQRAAAGEPRVIARAHNRRELDEDPSAHAEFLAMVEAARAWGHWRLSGCTVYVTLEPCVMCAGLMVNGRIDRCVFGATDPKAGALVSLFQLGNDQRLNHRFELTPGVLADECSAELKAFFKARRKARKRK